MLLSVKLGKYPKTLISVKSILIHAPNVSLLLKSALPKVSYIFAAFYL